MSRLAEASQLYAELNAAEKEVQTRRRALIDFVKRGIEAYGSTYAFARAVGINRGNLHRVLEEYEWNQIIIAQATGALIGTPIGKTNGNGKKAAP